MLASNHTTEEVIRANILNFNEAQLRFVEKLEDHYEEIVKEKDSVIDHLRDEKEDYENTADILTEMLKEVAQKVDELLIKKELTEKDLLSINALIDYSYLD